MPRVIPWTYLRKRPVQQVVKANKYAFKGKEGAPLRQAINQAKVISQGSQEEDDFYTETPNGDESTVSNAEETSGLQPGPMRRTKPAILAKAKEEDAPHFRLGHKEVWLPDMPVTLIQTEHLHPRFAKFKVPLHIGKLDFRDFLYHGYGVRALNIRTWVYQRPIEAVDYRRKTGYRPKMQWHRRLALKYMIVEMDEAFAWPVLTPEEKKAFNPELMADMEKNSEQEPTVITSKSGVERYREKWSTGTSEMAELQAQRKALRQQSQALLAGKMKWRSTKEDYPRPTFM